MASICKIAKMFCLHAFRVVCITTYSCQGRRNWGHCTYGIPITRHSIFLRSVFNEEFIAEEFKICFCNFPDWLFKTAEGPWQVHSPLCPHPTHQIFGPSAAPMRTIWYFSLAKRCTRTRFSNMLASSQGRAEKRQTFDSIPRAQCSALFCTLWEEIYQSFWPS